MSRTRSATMRTLSPGPGARKVLYRIGINVLDLSFDNVIAELCEMATHFDYIAADAAAHSPRPIRSTEIQSQMGLNEAKRQKFKRRGVGV